MNTIGKQISFDPLDYVLGAHDAKNDRDATYRKLKSEGVKCKRFVLRGQLKKYASFGKEDGRVRDVYYIQIF